MVPTAHSQIIKSNYTEIILSNYTEIWLSNFTIYEQHFCITSLEDKWNQETWVGTFAKDKNEH